MASAEVLAIFHWCDNEQKCGDATAVEYDLIAAEISVGYTVNTSPEQINSDAHNAALPFR